MLRWVGIDARVFFFSRSFLIRLVRAGAGHLFAFRTHVFRVCVQRVTVAAA